MNKRLDLTKLGGYPLTQKDADWLQESYRFALAAMSNMIGDKVILYGMTEGGGNVTAGWISINGELLPFEAGAIGTGEFIIDELVTSRTFNDGITKDVRFERVAKFSAGGPHNYADLVRLGTLKIDMPKKGDIKMVTCDAPYIAANFDISGLGINERIGWAICNGSNGTVDMGDVFPMGYKPGVREIGSTGGSKEVTLSSLQQGFFVVRQLRDDIGGGSSSVTAQLTFNGIPVPLNGGSNQSSLGDPLTVNLSAATNAIDKMNPFKTVLFIQKL